MSRTMGALMEKSFEVAAAMLAKAACAAVGLVNFVTVNLTWVPAAKVPDGSFTVSTDPVNAALHEAPDHTNIQTLGLLLVSKAMPAPDSVMAIPALGPAVMVEVGMNENVAVVAVALTEDVR
jgi:hypothetical protein